MPDQVNENAELIRRLFDAFAAGDLETINQALAANDQSRTPGQSQLAGTVVGREAVIAQLGRSREVSEGSYRIEVEDFLVAAARVSQPTRSPIA